MTVINEPPSEAEALTIDKCATALGVQEFSLLSRIQSGDITAARLRSGEMAIPVGEVERLSHLSVNSLTFEADASKPSESVLGIKKSWLGLKRQGEYVNLSVPDYPSRFTESEMNGYRAAFGAIANEYLSLTGLKEQLDKPNQVHASSEKEVCTSEIGVWQVRSTLLNLGQSDILLCQRKNEFAVIERFRDESLFAKANGNAQILLDGNDPMKLANEFRENAQLTLEFMASNMVAKAQKIVWQEYAGDRSERLIEAISQRCRLVVAPGEAISETPEMRQSHSHSHGHGMSM
ncbi:MAG: hypothetical protein ACREE6_04105 [Limisphaerales bacterium]